MEGAVCLDHGSLCGGIVCPVVVLRLNWLTLIKGIGCHHKWPDLTWLIFLFTLATVGTGVPRKMLLRNIQVGKWGILIFKTCALCSQEILGWRGKGFEPCSESWSWHWSAQAAAAVEPFSGRGGKSLGHPCGCKRFLELQLDLVDIECKNVKRFRMLILPIRWLRSASLS